ncbi:hypothetical protein F5B21DRAFT_519571, partial [Xylaria acuta]
DIWRTVTTTTTTLTVTNSADATRTVTAVVGTTLALPTTQTMATNADIFAATSISTTTDATNFVTETSFTALLTIDATSVAIISAVSSTTVTAALTNAPRAEKRSKCGGKKPNWLSSATSLYPSSAISSACSCLLHPTTVVETITKTGHNATATRESFVSVTASGVAIKNITSLHSEYATRTASFSTAKIYNTTATTSVTQTVVQTVDATATTTTTTTLTITDFETLYTSSTTTAIATVTVGPPAPTAGQCEVFGGIYNAPNGKQFATHCGVYFPINRLIGSPSYPNLFSDCAYTCSITSGCLGVGYDITSKLCDMFAAYEPSRGGYNSALLPNP